MQFGLPIDPLWKLDWIRIYQFSDMYLEPPFFLVVFCFLRALFSWPFWINHWISDKYFVTVIHGGRRAETENPKPPRGGTGFGSFLAPVWEAYWKVPNDNRASHLWSCYTSIPWEDTKVLEPIGASEKWLSRRNWEQFTSGNEANQGPGKSGIQRLPHLPFSFPSAASLRKGLFKNEMRLLAPQLVTRKSPSSWILFFLPWRREQLQEIKLPFSAGPMVLEACRPKKAAWSQRSK